jgi:hypothetical protein
MLKRPPPRTRSAFESRRCGARSGLGSEIDAAQARSTPASPRDGAKLAEGVLAGVRIGDGADVGGQWMAGATSTGTEGRPNSSWQNSAKPRNLRGVGGSKGR